MILTWPLKGRGKIKKTSKIFYHVSMQDHGEKFTLVPRIPRDAIGMEEEDFTTPRVCLASTTKDAFEALGFNVNKSGKIYTDELSTSGHNVEHLWIYKCSPNVVFIPSNGEYPEGSFKGSKQERAEALKGFVPDAGDTGEVWVLEQIAVTLVKVIDVPSGA